MRPALLLALVLATLAAVLPWRSAAPRAGAEMIAGLVHDDRGPVAGARVRFPATDTVTRSDARGLFRLAPKAGAERVTAAREGFFIAGAPLARRPLRLHLQRLPEEDHEGYAWVDPTPDPRR